MDVWWFPTISHSLRFKKSSNSNNILINGYFKSQGVSICHTSIPGKKIKDVWRFPTIFHGKDLVHPPIEPTIFFIRGGFPAGSRYPWPFRRARNIFSQIHGLLISWVFRLHDSIMQIPVMAFQMFLIPVMGESIGPTEKPPLGANYTPED